MLHGGTDFHCFGPKEHEFVHEQTLFKTLKHKSGVAECYLLIQVGRQKQEVQKSKVKASLAYEILSQKTQTKPNYFRGHICLKRLFRQQEICLDLSVT